MQRCLYPLCLVAVLSFTLGMSGGTCNIDVGDIRVDGSADADNSLGDTGEEDNDALTLSMEVVVGATTHDYSVDGLLFRTESAAGVGPGIDTASDPNWASDQPRLDLTVLFRGFSQEAGIPAGSVFDLSAAVSADSVTVIFGVSEPQSGIVGGPEPSYARYASTDLGSTGGEWVEGSQGKVVVNELTYDDASGDVTQSPTWEFDISLTQVTLLRIPNGEEQSGENEWPETILIRTARLR